MTEFQSHEPEFDYLKSLEIEEKINKVRWCRSSSNTRMLLSTNDKTVKLWKVRGDEITPWTAFLLSVGVTGCHALIMLRHADHHAMHAFMQVYEKKVSSLSNFNIENRQVANSGARVNPLNMPRLTQALHLPKVRDRGVCSPVGGLRVGRDFPLCIEMKIFGIHVFSFWGRLPAQRSCLRPGARRFMPTPTLTTSTRSA